MVVYSHLTHGSSGDLKGVGVILRASMIDIRRLVI